MVDRRRRFFSLPLIAAASLLPTLILASPPDHPEVKEWTMLVYINGHNDLAQYGRQNIREMEQVGSSPDVNVVVQWAEHYQRYTHRLYVSRSHTPGNKPTSSIVQSLPRQDMGIAKTLTDFVQWGVDHYPAKHYFIVVWNHGSGWHSLRGRPQRQIAHPEHSSGDLLEQERLIEDDIIHPLNISYDDHSGNSLTTPQLAFALRESARIIGHKIDIYGSDACLMAMAEIATEVADCVEVYVGSEENEPGEGWPYGHLLDKWVKQPLIEAPSLSRLLTTLYLERYVNEDESREPQMVTFSGFQLKHSDPLLAAFVPLTEAIVQADPTALRHIQRAASLALRFDWPDYADLGDFLRLLEADARTQIPPQTLRDLQSALDQFVISQGACAQLGRSCGASFWLPKTKALFERFKKRYEELKFDRSTHWSRALERLLTP